MEFDGELIEPRVFWVAPLSALAAKEEGELAPRFYPVHVRARLRKAKPLAPPAAVNGRAVVLDAADRALMTIVGAFGARAKVALILARPPEEIDAVLQPLGDQGLIERDGDRLAVTAAGRLALRQPTRSARNRA